MANKRIYQLDDYAALTGRYAVIDVSGLTEAEKILLSEFALLGVDADFTEELSVTKRSKSGENAITYALTVSVNFALADIHNISTVTGNLTINTTGIETGQTGAITFTIDATGGYTIASGTGTWKKLDNSALDFADCNVASTEYLVFYIIKGTTIYYSIDSVSP